MRFRNLVSGGTVDVSNEDVIAMMSESPHYEPVVQAPAPAPEPEPASNSKKPRKPKAEKPT